MSSFNNILNNWNCVVENDPGIMNGLMLGILFSGISFGLVYVIIFLLIWEFLYFGYLHANYRNWDIQDRILVILSAVLGFLLGRVLLEDDDHIKEYNNFFNDVEYYGKDFGWF